MPNSNGNNWYITGYIMLYSIHSIINRGLNGLSKRSVLKIAIALFIIYDVICFSDDGSYYYVSNFADMLTIYVFVYYLKNYCMSYCDDKNKQYFSLLVSFISLLILYVLKYFFIEFKTELYTLNNPLLFVMSFSLFNIFRNIEIKSNNVAHIIISISGLSIYVYLFHENILFRNLSRVKIVYWMFSEFGTNVLIPKVVAIAIVIYLICLLLSFVYKNTLYKLTCFLTDKLIIVFDNLLERIM